MKITLQWRHETELRDLRETIIRSLQLKQLISHMQGLCSIPSTGRGVTIAIQHEPCVLKMKYHPRKAENRHKSDVGLKKH